jgi:hypothetical protein
MPRVPRYLILTAAASATVVAGLLAASPDARADPAPHYVSCPGGYIATSLADCPPLPIHHTPLPQGHGGAGGGLLGGLLGGLGL